MHTARDGELSVHQRAASPVSASKVVLVGAVTANEAPTASDGPSLCAITISRLVPPGSTVPSAGPVMVAVTSHCGEPAMARAPFTVTVSTPSKTVMPFAVQVTGGRTAEARATGKATPKSCPAARLMPVHRIWVAFEVQDAPPVGVNPSGS